MSAPPPPDRLSSRGARLACAAILAGAIVAVYHNTLSGPFVFDDISAIVENPTIRHLGDLKQVLLTDAGHGVTVSGRPLLNLSLALCYAISGTEVWSYHAFNLLIHVLAALTLFGLVRRTLLVARRPRIRGDATLLAFTVALLWAVHPLQTESVTYVIQRAESLMGLFFLLTLYGFVRAASSPRPIRWATVAVLACLAGVGTKEVAALAPLLVGLYDRTFVSGTFREAWRRHRWLHVSLAATWVPLALLVAGAGWNRGGTVGFDVGMAPWDYWLTQFQAISHYLRLAAWPRPLVFEYGAIRSTVGAAVPFALMVLPLVAATLVALVRWPAAGFLGAWFFAILAPTSVMPGTMQTLAEHRMYLPLAAVIAAALIGLCVWADRRAAETPSVAPHWPVMLGLALALPLGVATEQRNRVYRDDLTLWRETVARSPASAKAQSSLGTALFMRNRAREALPHYLRALELDPNRVNTHYDLGVTYNALGQPAEATEHFQEALRLNPAYAAAHYQLGLALLQANRLDEAGAKFASAVQLSPQMDVAYYEWGVALAQAGRLTEAVEKYRAALRLRPDFVEAEVDLGTAWYRLNEFTEAAACFRRALRSNPRLAEVHFNLGLALARTGATEESIAEYAEAVRLNPAHVAGQFNLGVALARAGRMDDALPHLERGVALAPASPDGHYALALALLQLRRTPEAREHLGTALRLNPGFAPARQALERLGAGK